MDKLKVQELLDKIQAWRDDDTAWGGAACDLFDDDIEPFLKGLLEE